MGECPVPDFDALVARHYPDCEPVAVIGHACRFPESDDCEAFWRNLVDGRELSRRFSRQELLDAGLPAATVDAPNFVGIGTVVRDADAFDADLFGYSRQEAESIDPQQRLFLQIVWHALEHAGYAPRDVPHKTGVFGSARISTYPGREPLRIAEVAQVKGLQSLMGNDKDYLATRAAYKLNLRGPAITVQTACSSSLVAVHMACESLRAGECDMAVAGGVAISFPQQAGYLHQSGMIFSPDGHCRPFDAEAQGTFAGNGIGAVVLRRLADALRDGDPIIAVVHGSAINNDGAQKVGYTAPSVAGQREVIREAMALAGVLSGQIGLIEAHGTGTPLGDPIEVEALRAVFHRRGDGPPCALGSVKGNMGHLDTAAGIASLLKAILAVERGTIPPSLHFRTPNPALRLDDSPFHVPTQAQIWNDPTRLAGVSSFGIGGTNCHLIIGSLPAALRTPRVDAGMPTADPSPATGALLLSAASEPALRRLAGAYAEALRHADPDDLAYTARHGRQLDLAFRLAVPFCEETAAALAACAAGDEDVLVHHGRGEPGGQAWLFTGQGSHWPGMGNDLYSASPAFAASLDRCLTACDAEIPLDPPLRDALLGERGDLLERMEYAQPAIVAFELAMAAHWMSLGLKPDRVLGHSVGELAAAVVAGHYEPEPVMRLVRRRGALMDRCAGGAMLSAFADEATLLPIAQSIGLDPAAWNGAHHLVFSGERDAVDALAAVLDERDIRYSRLAVTGAAHSRLLDPILDAFQREAATLRAVPGRIPLISTLSGEPVDADALNAPDYWRRHMREPVRFIQALRTALGQGTGLFLEVGPDAPLTGIGRREAPDAARWIFSARRHQPVMAQVEQALLQLYAAGAELPWKTLLPVTGRRIHAPLYPFDRQRYWHEAEFAAVLPAQLAVNTALEDSRRVAAQAAEELELPRLQALYACVTKLHAIDVDTLVRRCVGTRIEQGVTALDVLRGGRLLPRHRQLLTRLLNACVEDGYYGRDGERYSVGNDVPHASRAALLDELRGYCEGLDVIAETVGRAGENLYAMMRGEVEPVAIIFPEGASSGVEVLYQDFSFGRYFNRIAAGVVEGLMRERRAQGSQGEPYRVLEVGGGTGGTTAWLLPVLANESALQYDFTDISTIFTRRAEQKFAAYDFLTYREFDLQKDAQAQGFEAGGYDLIVAANVIHATQHVGHTLANLFPLFKPGGRLLMREITRPMRLFDFVFGPLVPPLHDEAARGGELFLTTARWKEQCLAAGFEHVDWLPDDGTTTSGISEHVILATAPGRPMAAALPWEAEVRDRLLGVSLTDDGCYLADWSDCAGKDECWRERVRDACIELSIRHGSGRESLQVDIPAVPQRLSFVRLRWHAAPFGEARLGIEVRDDNDQWQPVLSPSPPAFDLPTPMPAPGTHYDWEWSPAGKGPVVEKDIELRGDCSGAASALRSAGIRVSTEATWIMLVLGLVDDDPLPLVDELIAALSDSERKSLVVVTRSAWRIKPDDEVDAAHHAIWGLLRVAATERGGRGISVVDIDAHNGWEALVPGLAAVNAGHPWVAVRDGVAMVPRLAGRRHSAPVLPAGALQDDGWHVVTGAFGGLGRLSVQWLASRGARRIALLAPRTRPDWPDFQRTMAERHGCELHWVPCDVGDSAQMTQALRQLEDDGGVCGVIHAAGVLHDMPLSSLDRTRLDQAFAVKAGAARTLYDWLRTRHGRYLLLYSSAAAALGAAGQGAHALASAYLDGLALAHRNDASPTVVSIGWGAWGETGRAADPGLKEKLAAGGMGLLDSAEGLWHLEQAVMRGSPYRLAMRIIPDRLDTARRELLAPASPVAAREKPSTSSAAPPPIPALSKDKLGDADAVAAWLTARIAAQLRLDDPGRISANRDLLQIGLDSLLFLELSSDIQRQLGVRLDAERAYRDLTVGGLSRLIVESAPCAQIRQEPEALRHDAVGRHLPFPLTPIQHAYWLGRTELIEYGGVACHVLFEWDKRHDEFDMERFERAWNALVQRHDMLRMVVDADGQQRILLNVPFYRIERYDLRRLSPERRKLALDEMRHELSYRVPPADQWPLFELRVSEIDDLHYRLHMNLDLLMFDVQSFKVMMDDLATAYRGEDLAPLSITFRDYVLAEQVRRREDAWQASWRYWQERLAELPPAPRLPLAAERSHTRPRFTTYQARLDKEAWTRLKREWRTWGVTPSAALLTLFAHTLERWCRQPEFTLNLTFFDRRPVHPEVRQLIGDFTSVLLIDFDLGTPCALRESIEQTQRHLWQRLAHSQVNGVELMRELGKGRAQRRQPLMPVVFTSMLGMSLDGLAIDQAMTSLLGDPVHVFTQTPQVWLDHQVMEIDGDLIFSWYCMDDVLAEGVEQTLFEDYQGLLRAVAARPELMNHAELWKLGDDGDLTPFAHRPWPLGTGDTAIDLRDVEDALRARADVRRAEVLSAMDGDSLEVRVVAADHAVPASRSPACDQVSLEPLDVATLAEVESAWRWLEARALRGIADTLRSHGLFEHEGQSHGLDEIHFSLRALPQYRRLVLQWLRLLRDQDWLREDVDVFVCSRSLAEIPEAAHSRPKAGWCQTIAGFLETCIEHHSALLTGERSPLELLFADGGIVAHAFYSDNPVARCLNANAARLARALAMDTSELCVLEVGAGTGAATEHILAILEGLLRTYRFTDVSPLFLDDARKRFSNISGVEYGLLDINRPLDFQPHPDAGYDLIVANQVMHDAHHVVHSLRRLRLLLRPGGRLLLIEATERDSALQMASVGFIEGLGAYADLRTTDDKPMLDLPMWRAALEQAGFTVELAWPETDHTPMRQHLVLARAVSCGRLQVEEMERDLRTRFGDALPPVRVRQCERLDVNGDASSSPSHAPANSPNAAPGEGASRQHRAKADEPDRLAVEREVAILWQELLARPVHRDSDFFQCGGDSLIATRMVARLNRSGLRNASLQSLFAHPTLAGFCATLASPLEAVTYDAVIPLAQGNGAGTAFVFHPSDGEVGAYLPLAKHLGLDVFGLVAPEVLHVDSLNELASVYAEAIRRQQLQGPYLLIGWCYGAFVAAETARILRHGDVPVMLSLLDPICRADFAFTDRAALLRLCAQGRVIVPLPDDLEKLKPDEQLACFARNAAAVGLVPSDYDSERTRLSLERIARLLQMLAHHPAPDPLPIPCLWLNTTQRPAHWAPAEHDWASWAPHAQRHTLDVDHWQLVMDETAAATTAALIREWQRGHGEVKERSV